MRRWATCRFAASCLGLLACAALAACRPPAAAEPVSAVGLDHEALHDDEALRKLLDRVLDFTLNERELSVDQQAAWQILHGVLAYGRQFPVSYQGKRVSAVALTQQGGPMRGWLSEAVTDERTGRVGLRALMDPGTKAGQGHPDQWFAVLAQAGVQPEETFMVRGRRLTMADYAWQVMQDAPRNPANEFSWTLIGLTIYFPTNHTWVASDGQTWSIERMMKVELSQRLSESACGGTHRLIGMAMALERHLRDGGKLEGVWKEAKERIAWAVARAREYQNPDGSFSTNYFERPGYHPDLAENLGTTGHTLEFLAVSLPPDELRADWIRRAAVRLCLLFEETRDIPLECGALYHAAHGLVLYREKLFGKRDYVPEALTATNGTAPPTDKRAPLGKL